MNRSPATSELRPVASTELAAPAHPEKLVVFAPCSYTGANRGDAALFHAMAAALVEELGPLRLVTTSFTPAADSERYGVEVLRMPLAPDGRLAGRLDRLASRGGPMGRLVPYVVVAQLVGYLCAMRLWVAARRVAPGLARRVLPAAHRDLTDTIDAASVVAAVPGGYLMAPTVAHYHWLYHVATLGLCALMGRRMVFLPGSFGPFPGIHRHVARSLFARCEIVMAREQVSVDEVTALGVESRRIRMSADTGFLLADGNGAAEIQKLGLGTSLHGPGLLGVSVMHHDFPGCADPGAAFEDYVEGVAAALDWCVEHVGARPLFVSQVDGDGEASAAVIARMRFGSQATSVDAELTPFGLKALYRKCELVVASRIHAGVISLSAGVPVVAIAYEHKCSGIMEMAGLSRHVVPMTEAHRLQPVLASAWAARAANRDAVAARLPAWQASAREAVQQVAAACGESGAVRARDLASPGRQLG